MFSGWIGTMLGPYLLGLGLSEQRPAVAGRPRSVEQRRPETQCLRAAGHFSFRGVCLVNPDTSVPEPRRWMPGARDGSLTWLAARGSAGAAMDLPTLGLSTHLGFSQQDGWVLGEAPEPRMSVPPQNPYVETLTPKTMMLGGGVLGGNWTQRVS